MQVMKSHHKPPVGGGGFVGGATAQTRSSETRGRSHGAPTRALGRVGLSPSRILMVSNMLMKDAMTRSIIPSLFLRYVEIHILSYHSIDFVYSRISLSVIFDQMVPPSSPNIARQVSGAASIFFIEGSCKRASRPTPPKKRPCAPPPSSSNVNES